MPRDEEDEAGQSTVIAHVRMHVYVHRSRINITACAMPSNQPTPEDCFLGGDACTEICFYYLFLFAGERVFGICFFLSFGDLLSNY